MPAVVMAAVCLVLLAGLAVAAFRLRATCLAAASSDGLARQALADLTRDLDELAAHGDEAVAAPLLALPSGVHPPGIKAVKPVTTVTSETVQEGVARASAALERARRRLRSTERRLERTVIQQAAVARLGQLALEEPDVELVMQELVDTVADVLAVDLVGIVQHGGSGYWLRAAGGPRAGDLARLATVPGPVPDTELTRRTRFHAVDPVGSTWAVGGVVVPVAGRPAAFGALSCAWAGRRELDAGELDFLRAAVNVLVESVNRTRAEKEVRHQALHDPLTGLPNRVLFLDRLRLSLAHAARRNSASAVLFLDLDGFKLVNDSLGHAAGDELLLHVATRLAEEVRPGDTVARFGGDEFVVLCDDLTDEDQVETLAERLLAALNSSITLAGGHDLRLRGSIGIAVSAGRVIDAEELVREADAAMYRAKERGRGRAERYDEVMRGVATSRLKLEQQLTRALELDELRLHHQPIVELESGRILGFESLVRWDHIEHGMVAPDEFISVAEETGLIVPIGAWVLRQACWEASHWHSLTRPGEELPYVSVNISLLQITRPGLVGAVAGALASAALPPRSLHLEITESVLMRDEVQTLKTLDALRSLGVVLVLDDFGTGYSSLAYVQRFPLQVLKVDQSFVADLGRPGEDDDAIVDAILQMARGLRVDVVAEGIERREQVDVLRRLGCKLGQGHYFSRPLTSEDTERLVRSGTAYPHLVA